MPIYYGCTILEIESTKTETVTSTENEEQDYIKKLEAKNSLDIVDEMESYLLDAINTSNSSFVSEDGVIEKWTGGVNKEEWTQKIKEASKTRREHLKKELNDEKGTKGTNQISN